MGRKPQLLRFNNESLFHHRRGVRGRWPQGRRHRSTRQPQGASRRCRRPSSFDDDDAWRACGVRSRRRCAKRGVPVSRVWGVGIGIPGVVNIERSTISTAPLIGVAEESGPTRMRWSTWAPAEAAGFRRERRQFRSDRRVHAAQGSRARSISVYLSVGTGVGGGIILDGRIAQGDAVLGRRDRLHDLRQGASSSHTSKAGWLEDRINHRALIKNKRSARFLKLARIGPRAGHRQSLGRARR